MAIELRQQLKLSQQLVMTPQLQQAIKLLQLSRVELEEVVNQELEENPVLEEVSEDDPAPQTETEASPDADVALAADSEKTQEVAEPEGLAQIDDWQTYLQGFSQGGSAKENYNDDHPSYENLLTSKDTLSDHLMWQLNVSPLDDQEKEVAAVIIGNIDDAGYLVAELDDVLEQTGVDIDVVEHVLLAVQQFDPAGVAARTLQECLLLQLAHLGLHDALSYRLMTEFSKELEEHRYPFIAKQCQVSVDDVFDAARFLSTLDPRPGSQYSESDVQYISPDIFVRKISGDYVVSLNDEGLANLRISSYYSSALSGKKVDAKTNEYIQEKMRGAQWLIKSIYQRQRTIYRVTKSIVKFQREFFDHGISYLKPLVLRDVADDIEMHESTISRVTTNKYVQTPQGLLELKFFFNSGIGTTGGDSVASESVKNRIKEIVAEENEKKPYSDQKIVNMLHENGIDIARRTVTKYREMLGISSSTARKRLY